MIMAILEKIKSFFTENKLQRQSRIYEQGRMCVHSLSTLATGEEDDEVRQKAILKQIIAYKNTDLDCFIDGMVDELEDVIEDCNSKEIKKPLH
jgi:hypothetical protein